MGWRPLLWWLIACGSAAAQLTVLDPNLQAVSVVAGIPGTRHQIGVDAAGFVYVGEEVTGGWTATSIHRVDPAGNLTAHWMGSWPMSLGEMVTHPADGLCYVLNHWQGALEHNHIVRLQPSGTWTVMHDVLWGVGHGLCLDAAGDFYVGVTGTFQPRQIYRVPAATLGTGLESPWAPGPGLNAWLAPASGGALLCADGPSVWRVRNGQPDVAVFTNPVTPGTTYEWRGLVANPFGEGHLASRLAAGPGAGQVTADVFWIGPGGPHGVLQASVPAPGDFAIARDGNGGLLVIVQGTLVRLTLRSPLPTPPGLLVAPAGWPVALPFTVALTGRPYALSPFLFAADLPLGPPLFPGGVLPIPPYGVAHTSLGLLPGFMAIRDGVGAFGPPDPSAFIRAGGGWQESYTLPPLLQGTTLVLQGYILDTEAPNGLFFITPPVFTTFL